LAKSHTELVSTNHCLIAAAVAEVDDSGFDVRLEPDPTLCCVRLRRSQE
jgi:hypothetical protein